MSESTPPLAESAREVRPVHWASKRQETPYIKLNNPSSSVPINTPDVKKQKLSDTAHSVDANKLNCRLESNPDNRSTNPSSSAVIKDHTDVQKPTSVDAKKISCRFGYNSINSWNEVVKEFDTFIHPPQRPLSPPPKAPEKEPGKPVIEAEMWELEKLEQKEYLKAHERVNKELDEIYGREKKYDDENADYEDPESNYTPSKPVICTEREKEYKIRMEPYYEEKKKRGLEEMRVRWKKQLDERMKEKYMPKEKENSSFYSYNESRDGKFRNQVWYKKGAPHDFKLDPVFQICGAEVIEDPDSLPIIAIALSLLPKIGIEARHLSVADFNKHFILTRVGMDDTNVDNRFFRRCVERSVLHEPPLEFEIEEKFDYCKHLIVSPHPKARYYPWFYSYAEIEYYEDRYWTERVVDLPDMLKLETNESVLETDTSSLPTHQKYIDHVIKTAQKPYDQKLNFLQDPVECNRYFSVLPMKKLSPLESNSQEEDEELEISSDEDY